ncbi:hypothetical protein AgCh_031380 [Apium graveolens]
MPRRPVRQTRVPAPSGPGSSEWPIVISSSPSRENPSDLDSSETERTLDVVVEETPMPPPVPSFVPRDIPAPGTRPRWVRRYVSVVRDFPPGCGPSSSSSRPPVPPLAPSVGGHKAADKSSKGLCEDRRMYARLRLGNGFRKEGSHVPYTSRLSKFCSYNSSVPSSLSFREDGNNDALLIKWHSVHIPARLLLGPGMAPGEEHKRDISHTRRSGIPAPSPEVQSRVRSLTQMAVERARSIDRFISSEFRVVQYQDLVKWLVFELGSIGGSGSGDATKEEFSTQ